MRRVVCISILSSLVGCATGAELDATLSSADAGAAHDTAQASTPGDTARPESAPETVDSAVEAPDVANASDASMSDGSVVPADASLGPPDVGDAADAPDAPAVDAPVAAPDTLDAEAAVDAFDSGAPPTDAGSLDSGGDAGVTALEAWIVRVGDGSAALTSDSTQVVIERRRLSDRVLVGTIALPKTASGSNRPFTLSGTATSEGAFARSADNHFATLAGYATGIGVASVKSTATSAVPRVVARIAADGTVDTSTTTTSCSGDNIRSAATADGSFYYLAGAVGGVTRIAHGGSGPALDVSGSGVGNARTVSFIGGALYGTTGASTLRMFAFASAIPSSLSSVVALPGSPTATTSPYALAGTSTSGSVVDRLYVCDDRATGGGPQRWRLASGTWTLDTTFTESGADIPCRGLAVLVAGSVVKVLVTTADNRLVAFSDSLVGVAKPAAEVIASAPSGTAYRGVVIAPAP